MTLQCPKVLIVQPRYAASRFMGHYDTPCELVGASQPMPPLGLITVAAMLPSYWRLHLVDENIRPFTESELYEADLVFTGGMLSQQQAVLELIRRCNAAGKLIVVGGSDSSSSPHVYAAADFLVIGEAEEVIGDLVAAFERGERKGRFERQKFVTDITRSPVPRFDLIDTDQYLQVSVQFSRGCPFTCEFCDIIELYGRVPRTKTNTQMLRELDALYQQGYRGIVYFVDDNFIGNKKACRALLPDLYAWQKTRGYPFQFYTAATLNIADDPDLLRDLRESGFFSIFIGIESGDADVLAFAKKKQNARRDIPANIRAIQAAGLFVTAGFVIGFDNEGDHLVEPMIKLIDESAIAICMLGLLYALPNTQLTRRLAKEGRLRTGNGVEYFNGSESCLTGLNFDTKRPRGAIIADFGELLSRLYDPQRYFERVHSSVLQINARSMFGSTDARSIVQDLKRWALFTWRLHRKYPTLVGHFWSTMWLCLSRRPGALKPALLMIAMYTHLGQFAERASREADDALGVGRAIAR